MSIILKPSQKGEVAAGRFQIPFRIYETGSGETIVCINGIQQSMAIWASFVHRFGRDHRIVLFDFPHQGKGKINTGSQDVSLDEQVDILDSVLTHAGIKGPITIFSASWGGVVATSFASRFPSQVKMLVMGGLGTRPNEKMIETITLGTKVPLSNRREIAASLIESFGQDLAQDIKNKITSQFEQMSEEALLAFYRHGLFVLSSRPLSEMVDLSRIRCKTILIRGENDTIIDADDVKFLSSQIPNSQVRTIKNAGHFLHLENDKLFDTYAQILKSIK